MKKYKFGVLGAGNMGTAIAEGAVRAGRFAPEQVLMFNRSEEKRAAHAAKGYAVTGDYTEVYTESEIVLLALDEADALFGLPDPDAIFDLLFRDGCAQYVAIKDGGNGAWAADKTTREKLPPYPCKPIEPIGAGDGFNAGFLAGILQGRDVVTAGRMGAICGALATQTPGDVEGYPDAAQMEAALTGAAMTYR